MKKSRSFIELRNIFPSWSKVRQDDQSIGGQFLNALAKPIDEMDYYLEDMRLNYFLPTVNLDEIDRVYTVQLGSSYEFTYNTTDPFNPVPSPPSLRGFVIDNTQSGNVDIEITTDNTLKSFWYDAVPTRANFEEYISGNKDQLLYLPITSLPYSGQLDHHLGGGKLFISIESGVQFISINEENTVDRGRVVLNGYTRKGTYESETIIFPWNEKQSTLKEWSEIDYVEAYDMEDTVIMDLRSADFNWGPYISFYNLRWSDIDTKVDEFWDFTSDGSISTLDRVGYISDQWRDLIMGFSEKTVKDSWELLDEHWSPVYITDIAVQPFADRVWAVDNGGSIYCYDLAETIASGVNYLLNRTPGSYVRFELDEEYIVRGDDILITPLFVRPIADINKYRIWYQTPSKIKHSIKNGVDTVFDSAFWNYPTESKRELEGQITVTASERGEYLFVLEAVLNDDSTHEDRVLVPVKYKVALNSIDLSPYLNGTILGIDFDSDQRMWIKTSDGYYRFSLHSDLMLVDYDNKVVYLREEYSSIEVD